MVQESFKKYLAGFFDGDGSITVEKLNKSGYTLRIKFFQSNENWINRINRLYPFLNKTNNSQRRDNNKIAYELRAAGNQIEPLVDDLLPYCILKYEQLLEAKKFFKLINVKDKRQEKEEIYLKLKQLKKSSQLKPYDRVCKEYIAGLFDAEGSVGLYSNTLRVKITQKSDVNILQNIADIYSNTNKTDNYAVSFYGTNALDLLTDIAPFCIYKIKQVNAAIGYIGTLNLSLTDEIQEEREEYRKIIRDEKMIDTCSSLFVNQESHKQYLRNCFDVFSKLSYADVIRFCKRQEIEQTKVFTKFENKIYNTNDWSSFNIKPQLEFCETNNQLQIYQYYRKKVSSLPTTGVIGRSIRILVKDNITNKYIGIMCLSSDVYSLGERDNYIKATSGSIDWKDKYLNNIMNLSCCVPLQPFGFNTTGGKLLASLAFSREIFDYYVSKYKEPLLAIVTTSINGKSIQYDRLTNLKLIGYTKGYGSVNIPDKLFKACTEYNNVWKVIQKSDRVDRFNFLKNILSHLELSQKILQHDNKRGIYFGYVFSSKLNETYDVNELQQVGDIYNVWKRRWCDTRLRNLTDRNAIKTTFDLYTNSSFQDCITFELPPIQEKIINDNLIKEVLSYKNTVYSQAEACTILNKKYNTQLVPSDISRIYTGKIKPDVADDEYLQLMSIKQSKKKITDEQIYFILDSYNNKKYKTYDEIVAKFNNKFDKKITKGTISDVVSGKTVATKPLPKKECAPQDITTKFKQLDEQQLLTIIRMKNEHKTTQEVADYVKKAYNIFINRNYISKLWLGEDVGLSDEIKESQDYKEMLSNTKQRTVKAKKFTEDELQWLKSNNLDKSLGERAKLFEQKFGKTVTKQYVRKM